MKVRRKDFDVRKRIQTQECTFCFSTLYYTFMLTHVLWMVLHLFLTEQMTAAVILFFNAKTNYVFHNEIILNTKRQCQFFFSSDFLHTR